ncbi:hypothetical protein BD626DRAFT_585841 [Schizophyllum amplum]|uniref:Uncharacterized protein n=1 Tax=Schizophyllum amplum TaxID=97359 RepID=A0A550C2I7_9AGAR|nr:hypothetical protein BD626DRAFT_585841 [Auriculariopsis ampla]
MADRMVTTTCVDRTLSSPCDDCTGSPTCAHAANFMVRGQLAGKRWTLPVDSFSSDLLDPDDDDPTDENTPPMHHGVAVKQHDNATMHRDTAAMHHDDATMHHDVAPIHPNAQVPRPRTPTPEYDEEDDDDAEALNYALRSSPATPTSLPAPSTFVTTPISPPSSPRTPPSQSSPSSPPSAEPSTPAPSTPEPDYGLPRHVNFTTSPSRLTLCVYAETGAHDVNQGAVRRGAAYVRQSLKRKATWQDGSWDGGDSYWRGHGDSDRRGYKKSRGTRDELPVVVEEKSARRIESKVDSLDGAYPRNRRASLTESLHAMPRVDEEGEDEVESETDSEDEAIDVAISTGSGFYVL